MNGFTSIVRAHAERYPLMQPQDYGKLAYQSAFGPGHMITDESAALQWLLAEWQSVSDGEVPVNPEPIGNGLCRFHLTGAWFSAENAQTLVQLFIQSARKHKGSPEGLNERLDALSQYPVNGMAAWLAAYRENDCPPVHHSDVFREAYHPHYRVLLEPLAIQFLKQCG